MYSNSNQDFIWIILLVIIVLFCFSGTNNGCYNYECDPCCNRSKCNPCC